MQILTRPVLNRSKQDHKMSVLKVDIWQVPHFPFGVPTIVDFTLIFSSMLTSVGGTLKKELGILIWTFI